LAASAAAEAQQRGVPQNGFPNWQERMMYVYTNRSRADPVTELAGCAACAEKACYPSALAPVIPNYNLQRAARFHSAELEYTGCFQHDSPGALVAGIQNVYVPVGSCLGQPACAYTGGIFTCNTAGTNTFTRISAFGTSGSAENIAYYSSGASPRMVYDLWIFEADSNPACGFRSANGHRYSILNGNNRALGVGYYKNPTPPPGNREMYTQDFGSTGTPTGSLITGGHDPLATTSGTTNVNFRVNYYNTGGGPTSAKVNVNGTCTDMTMERGVTANNSTWLSTIPLTGTTCRRYNFEFVVPGGATVLLPEVGTYGVGGPGCADYQAAAASACPGGGNQAPTIATPASATPTPVGGTTTALSVLGADDGGEAALTYTWSASGPATVTYSANGTNGAKASTATFTAAGSYTFTVTVRDAQNVSVTSTVTVQVNQTGTSVTVAPGTANVPVLGTQQFTASARDQFGAAMASQPAFTWTTSGGGAVNATGLYTAGSTPGGPYSVTATAGSINGAAVVSVTAGSPPTVVTAAAATPNPVTATTTALSVLGGDDGGEAALTYTWSVSGPAAVTYSVNGTNAARATTATFAMAGSYTFTVTLRDAATLTATSSVTVTVNQTLAAVVVSPAAASVVVNGTRTFTASGTDQFGNAMSPQPAWGWAVSGGGSISPTGVFTAGAAVGGPYTVTATSGARSGTAQVTVTAGNAPSVATPAAAAPSTVTGSTANLSVLGADDGGEATLTYNWSASGPATVTYSANSTNGAKATTATFTRAGSYTFTVTITDSGGQTVTSTVTVTVQQTLTSVTVTPGTASVALNGTLNFTANARDQFTNAMSPQPAFAWTVSGGGTIGAATGVFTAGAAAGGPHTVTATAGARSGTAQVTVANGSAPTVATAAAAIPNPVTALTTALAVLGADDGGEAALTYTWTASGPAAVTFSANGTNAAKASTATFSAAGSYTFTVMLQDAGGLVTTSSVTVTVQQTPTAVAVVPLTATTTVGGTVGFTASATDQFSAALVPQPTFTWTVSGGGSISSAGLFTATTAGGPFTVTATAGSVNGTAVITVASAPDTTLPTVAITAPADGATVSGVVTIAANAMDDRGIARVDFLVDGVSVGSSTTAPYAVSWNTAAALAPAGHVLTARATDTSGNVGTSADVTVTVTNAADTLAPVVAITSPEDGAEVRGRFNFIAAATDDVGVARVVLSMDGAELATLTSAPYAFSIDADAIALGDHTLTARAFDAAGSEASATIRVVHPPRETVLGQLDCGCSSGSGALAGLALLLLRRRRARRAA
jgi:Bacterial Ig domain